MARQATKGAELFSKICRIVRRQLSREDTDFRFLIPAHFDVTDEMSQSKLYSRLRLNPVPESILSPDVPVPPKPRPAQMDDPVAARRIKGSRHHDVMNTKRHKDNTNQVIRNRFGMYDMVYS